MPSGDRGDGPLSDPEFVAGLRPVPSSLPGEPTAWPAVDIEGVEPGGARVRVGLDEDARAQVLLAFLAIRCDGCAAFWEGLGTGGPLAELADRVRVVVVTKGPSAVDPVAVGRLASSVRSDVVMSDRAWADYRVTGYPFFVLVDVRSRKVVGEAVAFGVDDVVALVSDPRGQGSAG